MRGPHAVGVALAVLVALVVQASAIPALTGSTLVPNLCLLITVGVGIRAGEIPAMVTGFAAGLALDLTPPADHLAGRWALALVVAGSLAGRVAAARTPRPGSTTSGSWRTRVVEVAQLALMVAAASFVATSVFALSGLVFGEVSWGLPELIRGVLVAVLLDLAAAAVVLPFVVLLARRRPTPQWVAG